MICALTEFFMQGHKSAVADVGGAAEASSPDYVDPTAEGELFLQAEDTS